MWGMKTSPVAWRPLWRPRDSFWSRKNIFPSIFGHQNPEFGSGSALNKNAWNGSAVKPMRIHKSTHDTEVKYCVREISRNITSFLDHTVTSVELRDYSTGIIEIVCENNCQQTFKFLLYISTSLSVFRLRRDSSFLGDSGFVLFRKLRKQKVGGRGEKIQKAGHFQPGLS